MQIFRSCLKAFDWRPHSTNIRPLLFSLARFESWVAEEPNAGIVGFLTMEPVEAYVDHLFVDQDWRLCGVGRGLLQAARRRAGRPLTLTVDAENRFARGAYQALGFEPLETASDGRRRSGVLLRGG